MAKFIKTTLPKIISRANKDISAIIESDLVTESNLLKKLVDHVAKSNKKIAKDRDKRMQDTKDKIDEFDSKVAHLNQEIDEIDHETLIRQLNQMLKTKEDVFKAKQSLRFYEASKLPKTINLLEEQTKQIQENLLAAQHNISTRTFQFTTSANQFFSYVHHAANKVTNIMVDEYIKKMESIRNEASSLETLKTDLFSKEKQIEQLRNDLLKTLSDASLVNGLTLYTENSDEDIDQKIESEFIEKKQTLIDSMQALYEQYTKEQTKIKDDFFAYEQRMSKELHESHQEQINKESMAREDTKIELKNIKFMIMEAEKKQDYRQVKSLIREYDKAEEKLSKSEISRIEDELDRLTTKEHTATLEKLYNLEQQYIKSKSDKELSLALLNIYHEQDKHNYLLQTDYEQLLKDQQNINNQLLQTKAFYDQYKKAKFEVIKIRFDIRLLELDILKNHEQSKLTFMNDIEELITKLNEQINQYVTKIKDIEEQKYNDMIDAIFQIKQSLLKIDLEKQLITIDHRIMNRQNERLIQSEKVKDQREQKIITLESQIEVALKEKELQLIKVKSLYEYEKRLAEEQVSRISGGIDVNDAFVKTTLENQLLFAEQQIKCAKGEYDIRLESIQLTKEQEISYALQKLEQHKHHYDQEIEKLEKIRKDQLEDLDYKMMLFTSPADHRKFLKQKEELTNDINEKIDEIEQQIRNDHQITRYQQMIDKANSRFEKAQDDAMLLRDQTIQSFQALYDKTKEKYDDLEETSHSEESKNLTPVLNNQALSKAHERLEQATKEAEEFYQERISEPEILINQYRTEIEEFTRSDTDDEFIVKQTELKEELKQEFITNEQMIIDRSKEEKQQFQSSFANMTIEQMNKEDYLRSTTDIEKNYQTLRHQEEKRARHLENELDTLLKDEQQTIEKTMSHIDTKFGALIKNYKSYLKTASKGINKQEREIKKEANRQLKLELADAKKNLELKKN
ncbi:MAG: hypothetical protein ACVCEJ_01225 [Candidatus Izemoplasmataceae bacterium]